jgi:hypothetical protein
MQESYCWVQRERLDMSGHEVSVRRLVRGRDEAERAKAAELLGTNGHIPLLPGFGPDWISALVDALMADSKSSVRCAAATALGNVASYPARSLCHWLTSALEADQDGAMRHKASATLKTIGWWNSAAVSVFKKALQKYRGDASESESVNAG